MPAPAEVLKKSVMGLAVTLLFFAAVEGVLFVVGVTPLSDRADPYVGFAGYSPLFVESTAPDGSRVLRTSDAKASWFNPQRFTVRKASGTTRIFCLGGSTTYGRPYEDATSFCGWLREFVSAAHPSREWEVVNAGGISYASYRVARLMEELADYEPDLFVIYTGHNEFLERRTYDRLLNTPEIVRNVGALASGLRLYSAMSDVLYPEQDVLDTELDVVLDQSVGPEDYRRDDTMRDAVLEHFRSSVERMVDMGRQAGAEVLLVTPASNLRDFSPFKAEPSPGLDAASVARAGQLAASIADLRQAGDFERAAALADEALAIDPRNADLLFLRGRALLGLGDAAGARAAFIAARDEDVAPLRALTPVTGIVAEIAERRSTGLVDFEAMMDAASADGIPGDDYFLDHVHPSIEAHGVLGLAILDELVAMGVASPAPSWGDAAIADISDRVVASIDEAAHARALANLALILCFFFNQYEALTG
ncbi:MAG: SGNH/GDSL hydrolase family protein, partial [Gemmatimonadetes bacterium]|nr:SGNH/GDSL hydrolase family protein [Gemmatimonadota bacterium]